MSTSFTTAAKHLFRHLHEPRALRKNPLVRRYFEDAGVEGSGPARERAILERIHARVREGADRSRDADLREGKDERALRQHAIVMQQCLARRPIANVAAELGISFGYCYQERAEICGRVARYVAEPDEAPAIQYLPQLDEFRVLADRIVRAGSADPAAALVESAELIRVAPSAQEKVEALRIHGNVALHFGDVESAEASYRSAASIYKLHLAGTPSPAREVGQACIDLLGSRLAYQRVNAPLGIRMLERAVRALVSVQTNAPSHVRELYVESLAELAVALWNSGELEKSYECIAAADAGLSAVRAASFGLRTRITLTLWKLRNHLLLGSKAWVPTWQRVNGLTGAFELAYAAGFFREAIAAVLGLAELHVSAGNENEVFRAAQTALLLAKQQPSEQLHAHTSIEVASMLLTTKAWKRGLALVPNKAQLDVCSPYHREIVTSFLGVQRAFRMHDYAGALTRAGAPEGRGEFTAVTLSRHLVAAQAAHELGRKHDAMALIEAAIPAAERLGSAPALRDAYSIAANITGSPRLRRRASEVTRLLIG